MVFAGNTSLALTASDGSRSYKQQKKDTANAVLFDPSLSSQSGHQPGIVEAYEGLIIEAGCRLTVKHAYRTSFPKKKNWHPYFLVEHHTLAFRAVATRQELTNVNNYFENEYAQVINQLQPVLCVFATARFTNILGAVKAICSSQLARSPAIIFTIFEADDTPDCSDSALIRSSFEEAASILGSKNIRYKISVETTYIRDFLVGCGFKSENVNIYEYVSAHQVTTGLKYSNFDTKKIRVGYVGGSRPTRNPELIADLVIQQNLSDRLCWCTQLNLDYIERHRGQKVREKLVRMNECGLIELYESNLTQFAYNSLFCSLDLLVMPYSERYQKIGSGPLCEAIYAEAIPIVPKKSSMNALYSSLGGDAPNFDILSSTAIDTAIIDGVDRLAALKHSAVEIRRRWLQHPSSVTQWHRDMSDWLSLSIK